MTLSISELESALTAEDVTTLSMWFSRGWRVVCHLRGCASVEVVGGVGDSLSSVLSSAVTEVVEARRLRSEMVEGD